MAVVNGTDNSDTLVGTTDADSVSGAGGQDTIYGGRGNDTLSGGADNDSMGGAVGSDYLDGGTGNDTLLGDGVAINPANYPSSGPDNDATGQIINNAGFAVDLYQIDTVGQMVFKGTVPNGATWSGATGTNYNWGADGRRIVHANRGDLRRADLYLCPHLQRYHPRRLWSGFDRRRPWERFDHRWYR